MICEQKGNILSTNFEPKTEKERCTKNGDVAHVKKPAWLDMYNDSMGGVNSSDKLHLSTPLVNLPKTALQAATILVAMASEKKNWRLNYRRKSPFGDQRI